MSNTKKKGQQKKIIKNFLLSDVRNLFVKKIFYIPVSYNLGNINWFLIAVAKHWLNTVWTVPNCKILFKVFKMCVGRPWCVGCWKRPSWTIYWHCFCKALMLGWNIVIIKQQLNLYKWNKNVNLNCAKDPNNFVFRLFNPKILAQAESFNTIHYVCISPTGLKPNLRCKPLFYTLKRGKKLANCFKVFGWWPTFYSAELTVVSK